MLHFCWVILSRNIDIKWYYWNTWYYN